MTGARAAGAAFLLALAVRVGLLLVMGGPSAPLEGDERGYAAAAGSLARGEGYGFTIEGTSADGKPVVRRLRAFRAPLLPAVLAPVHGATGGDVAALRLWCCVLGALAAPLAWDLGRRVAPGTLAAPIAAVLTAGWPSHAWLSTRVLSEPLDAALLLAAASLLLGRRWLFAGGALGLAVLCRPGGLPAAALLVGAAAILAAPREKVRAAGLVLAGVVVFVAPWVVRNWVVLGRPLLVTTSGVTLWGGNCPGALESGTQGKWRPPERACWNKDDFPFDFDEARIYFLRGFIDEPNAGADLGVYGWSGFDEAESDAKFAGLACEWIREHPGSAARLALWKVIRFFDPDTRSTKDDATLKAIVGWLSWWPAMILSFAALLLGRHERRPAWWIAVALLAGHLATTVVTYGDARMRAPIEPALLVLLVAPLLAPWVTKWTRRADPATLPG